MTVRTWFRLQRAALYARDDSTFGDLERLITRLLAGQPLDRWEKVGTVVFVFNATDWDRLTRTFNAVQQSLTEAMEEIERESAWRAARAPYLRHLLN